MTLEDEGEEVGHRNTGKATECLIQGNDRYVHVY